MKHYQSSLTLILIIALSQFQPSSQNDKYDRCSQALLCGGTIGRITYPFFDGDTRPDYCGQPGFKVGCTGDGRTQINVSTHQSYFLQAIDYGNKTVVVNTPDTWDTNACPRSTPVNITVDSSSILGFTVTSDDEHITYYYGCKSKSLALSVPAIKTNCSVSGSGSGSGYYLTQAMWGGADELGGICEGFMFIPILKTWADTINAIPGLTNVRAALETGFELELIADLGLCEACLKSGGQCGHDWGSSKFVCYCPDQDEHLVCNPGQHHHNV